jgi:hypothetical protein
MEAEMERTMHQDADGMTVNLTLHAIAREHDALARVAREKEAIEGRLADLRDRLHRVRLAPGQHFVRAGLLAEPRLLTLHKTDDGDVLDVFPLRVVDAYDLGWEDDRPVPAEAADFDLGPSEAADTLALIDAESA